MNFIIRLKSFIDEREIRELYAFFMGALGILILLIAFLLFMHNRKMNTHLATEQRDIDPDFQQFRTKSQISIHFEDPEASHDHKTVKLREISAKNGATASATYYMYMYIL